MPDDTPGIPAHIDRFVPGDTTRTPMHASASNAIVDCLNALLAMRGMNGIRVVPAEAGFVIELDDTTKNALGMLPTVGPDGSVKAPTGLMKFQGNWDATAAYKVNDLVIHRSAAAINAGWHAGTFICIKDNTNQEPIEILDNDTLSIAGQEYWQTVAKGFWPRLVFKAGTAIDDCKLDINTLLKIVTMDGASGFGSISMSLTEDGNTTGTGGHSVYLREIDVSISDGMGGCVAKKMRGLFSEVY